MEIMIRITSEDRKSEVIVFTQPDNVNLSISKTQHQKEVIEKCLEQIFDCKEIRLAHHLNGAPFLPEFEVYRISISHSEDWYAIQLSQVKDVGIDIQVIKKKLFDGRSYFINEDEERNLNLTNENLYLIWSAKEAVYKFKKGEISKYKEGMTVVEIGNSSLLVQVEKELIKCSFFFEENFVALYVD